MSAALTNPASNELLDAALTYATLGLRVLPLRAGSKLPQTDHGCLDATTELEQIRTWWQRWPRANVGIACGATRDGWQLVVIDLDRHNPAEDGIDAWAEMVTAAGGEVPRSPQSLTPSGGMHIPLRLDVEVRNSAATNFPAGIDIRGEGGYIVAPPSISKDGVPYAWEEFIGPDELEIGTAPTWLLDRLTSKPPERAPRVGPAYTGGDRPGDWLAANKEWRELLEANGATYVETRRGPEGADYELWVRPGKDERDGPSATLGYGGSNVLKVFTSAWPGLTQEETYTPFGFFAAVNHGGDQAAAASAIRVEMKVSDVFKPTMTSDRPPLRSVPTPADENYKGADKLRWPYTDLGNARRLVHAHGKDLRYSPQFGAWFAWGGKAWSEDLTGEVHRKAKHVVDAMTTEIVEMTNSDDRKALYKHWDRSQSSGSLAAMVNVAVTEPQIPILIDELDANLWLFNTTNGTIDLSDGSFKPHDRADLITKITPVTYDPKATCPTWEWFIKWAMQGDEQMIEFVQRAVGYSLTGQTTEQVLFFLNGGGENGKSTFLSVLEHIMGDYAIAAEADLLLATDSDRHSTGLTDLVGRRFVVAQELDEGRRLAEATVKQLTGGDTVRARRMRQDFFQFRVDAKFWIAANHRPQIRGTDHAIWRRIRLIPFTATIAAGEKDARLPDKLRAEASGILNWALEGLLKWRQHGLGEAAAITDATNSYRADQDHLGRFLDEACVIHESTYCPAKELRTVYEKWCEENGERPWTQRALGNRLTERGFDREKRGHANTYVWLGIGIISEFGPFETGGGADPEAPADHVSPHADHENAQWSAPESPAQTSFEGEMRTMRTESPVPPWGNSVLPGYTEKAIQGPHGPHSDPEPTTPSDQSAPDDRPWL